ncbi:hypothetical protein [Bacteroides caccae]|uniref:hypothetical protein n=1 Tax=Bacteroides caccae TaxID=47678 RepID=UPI003D2A7ED3
MCLCTRIVLVRAAYRHVPYAVRPGGGACHHRDTGAACRMDNLHPYQGARLAADFFRFNFNMAASAFRWKCHTSKKTSDDKMQCYPMRHNQPRRLRPHRQGRQGVRKFSSPGLHPRKERE